MISWVLFLSELLIDWCCVRLLVCSFVCLVVCLFGCFGLLGGWLICHRLCSMLSGKRWPLWLVASLVGWPFGFVVCLFASCRLVFTLCDSRSLVESSNCWFFFISCCLFRCFVFSYRRMALGRRVLRTHPACTFASMGVLKYQCKCLFTGK